ncbi:transcriptional regulator with XRE-family HTH domain [Cupriavidus metallidurans]|uniref:helix-turn-helix domain-containing protein n=1 Tax=Cupriavidus metallidurans TaxID=119219 RepID=UPI00068949A6|nr:helix-turn-helix transcriptional regulator [Cupriavidus metallidurans]AVA32830.1 XRE family transcriptional regulator [Cupriavidus metallidurans]MDE4917004.1 helix-turn-helix transcriptional regulator [Cupriavidus metallidurans]UBM11691.1 helix-turn-helix domain-containing protein [Cupriavidus metallidurans]
MSYRELIERALHGRSVLKAAMEMNVPQPTLRKYCNGERLPDYLTAWKIAQEAGMEPGEVFALLAEEEAKRKGSEWTLSAKQKAADGFDHQQTKTA